MWYCASQVHMHMPCQALPAALHSRPVESVPSQEMSALSSFPTVLFSRPDISLPSPRDERTMQCALLLPTLAAHPTRIQHQRRPVLPLDPSLLSHLSTFVETVWRRVAIKRVAQALSQSWFLMSQISLIGPTLLYDGLSSPVDNRRHHTHNLLFFLFLERRIFSIHESVSSFVSYIDQPFVWVAGASVPGI